MVVRYKLSSFPARILGYTIFTVNKKFSSFLTIFIHNIKTLCGQVTLKKGFREDLFGEKKYQD
jgi:hypothetical protein